MRKIALSPLHMLYWKEGKTPINPELRIIENSRGKTYERCYIPINPLDADQDRFTQIPIT